MFFDNLYTKNTITHLFVFELNSNANEDALNKSKKKWRQRLEEDRNGKNFVWKEKEDFFSTSSISNTT
jgi:hypothetical protein